MRELDYEDLKGLKNCIRMDRSSFCDLLDKVRHLFAKKTQQCVRRFLLENDWQLHFVI